MFYLQRFETLVEDVLHTPNKSMSGAAETDEMAGTVATIFVAGGLTMVKMATVVAAVAVKRREKS